MGEENVADPRALQVRFRTTGKALPPRPIRLSVPGWAGSPEIKMQNGSEPQPWHCRPFTQAATNGLELIYPYETECHVINDGGVVRFEGDFSREPGPPPPSDLFSFTEPQPPQFYTLVTSTDIRAPRG